MSGAYHIHLAIARLARDLLVNGLAAAAGVPGPLRRAIYSLYGLRIATRSVAPGCFFGSPRVQVGPGTTVNRGCFFDSLERITIGRDCGIGLQVMFVTSTHEIGGETRRTGRLRPRPITIHDGCAIGSRAVILPGVTVGQGCLIAAGAVVAHDCAPNGLYSGVPAARVKELPRETRAGRRTKVALAGAEHARSARRAA
ncbi:MAG: acyltransferase [Candidatus Eisenbacteria bacterium]|nr:acyltransferase [Candidatus Eisenbacteria bacterium]